MYSAIINRLVKKSFQLVNEHRYTELVQGMALNVQHTFTGDHALGGSGTDQGAVKELLDRLGRIIPGLRLVITKIIVDGWSSDTTAAVQWEASATLENGEPYYNCGVHIIKVNWGKAVSLDVYEDSGAVANAMGKQFQSGIKKPKRIK